MRYAKRAVLPALAFLTLLPACSTKDNTTPVTTHKWAWVAGSNTVNQVGNYGTLGTAAASNVPGARERALSWRDSSGKIWLFGGYGYDSASYLGQLNDLWKLDPASVQWTWVSGSNLRGQHGVYGTKGVAAPSNVPGARIGAVSWIAADDRIWLFGGLGFDEAGFYGNLNDLWRFDPASLEWTWVSGASAADQTGVYGTKGTADPANVPGARNGAVSWIDAQGVLWLFGGYGADSDGVKGWLNDLWNYDPAALAWTWISGSDTEGQDGTHGTKGTAAADNIPGGRNKSTSWSDLNGNLWLFGGDGLDNQGERGNLNDMWKFNPTTLLWTWMAGLPGAGNGGIYGTQDFADALNYPGSRYGGSPWVDATGNLWLFGGYGEDSAGTLGWLNDMWMFNVTTSLWTWVSGSNVGGQKGFFGTLGTADIANVAGSRYFAASWIDQLGRFWLFGGYGADSVGTGGRLNDLWYMVK